MKTVTLFRHAKSDWKDMPGIEDFDRPLAKRGVKDAPRMGAAMQDHGFAPDLILCSPSVRTRQTLSLAVEPGGFAKAETLYDERLYHASVETMLGILQNAPESTRNIMIVGHNPGLQALASTLIANGPEKTVGALKQKFPTAAVAIIRFGVEKWTQIAPCSGELVFYATPKTLKAA